MSSHSTTEFFINGEGINFHLHFFPCGQMSLIPKLKFYSSSLEYLTSNIKCKSVHFYSKISSSSQISWFNCCARIHLGFPTLHCSQTYRHACTKISNTYLLSSEKHQYDYQENALFTLGRCEPSIINVQGVHFNSL